MNDNVLFQVVSAFVASLRGWALGAAGIAHVLRVWRLLGAVEDEVGGVRGKLREQLLAYVASEGREDERGSATVVVEGTTVKREARRASEPDAKGVKELLARRDIPVSRAFDEVKVLQLNATKLQHLIDTGKVTAEEVEALRRVTYALKVKESDQLLEQVRL